MPYKYRHFDQREGEGLDCWNALKNTIGEGRASLIIENCLNLKWEREPRGEFDSAPLITQEGEVVGQFIRS